MSAPEARGRRLWTWGITALVLAICASLLVGTIADPDLWGHVLFGQLTLAVGHVPRIDPYAYASAGTWINHEWLAEVAFGGVFDLAGAAGLVALKTLLGVALLGWIYRRLVRAGLDLLRAGAVLLVGALPLFLVLGSVRPHLFTFVLFAVTLAVLRRAEDDRRALWWLVPIMALWVNVHGGFLAGLGVAGVWVAVAVGGDLVAGREAGGASSRGSALRRIVAPATALAAAGVATLVNPYGLELPRFLVETATVPRPYITEWQPLRLGSSLGVAYLVLLGGAGVTVRRTADGVPPPRLAVLAVTALAPFMAVRHLPLFALSVMLLLDDALADVWSGHGSGRSSIAERGGWLPTAVGATSLLLACLALVRSAPDASCISLDFSDEIRYPTRSVALLEASGARADLAIFFNWGEYAIWHLAPEIRVGMDGRRETVYPDSVYQSYLRFIGGTRDWDAHLETGPADLALVPPGKPAYNLLRLDERWTLAYEDSVAGIFGRTGSDLTARVRRTPVPEVPVGGEAMCFP